MELWDIYDEDRLCTGDTVERGGRELGEGEYHLVVQVCLFSSKGELLIQRRAKTHGNYGGLWDLSAGGSALAGETARQAAARELKEELGVEAVFPRPILTVSTGEVFDDIFLIRKDVPLSSLVLQKEEVSEAKWAGKEEVLALRERGAFISYRSSFLALLFELYENNGNMR